MMRMLIHAAPVVSLLAVLAQGGGHAGAPLPPSPQPQRTLRPMLKITWARGPNLPQGFQDSDGGFLGTQLITVGGFCGGGVDRMKPGQYPRGFLQKAWAWDLSGDPPEWV